MEWRPGWQLHQEYRLELNRELGSGGYGEVFLAVHKSTGISRAVKRVRRDNREADDLSRNDLDAFFAAVKERFGFERADVVEVRPTLDTVAVLERMRKAHKTELNLERQAKRREQRIRRRERQQLAVAPDGGSRQGDPSVGAS